MSTIIEKNESKVENEDNRKPATIQVKRDMYNWMKALSYTKGMGGNLDELFEYFREQELSDAILDTEMSRSRK